MDLTEEEIEVFKDVFGILDCSKDGSITEQEIEYVSECLGLYLTDHDIAALMHMTDRNGVGHISFGCFVKTIAHIMSTPQNDELMRSAFRVYDKTNCGYITTENLTNVLVDLNQRIEVYEIEKMIRAYDTDGDGRLSYDEFVEMMTNH